MIPLEKKFIRQGNWLFKWRSYLPLVIVPMLFISLKKSEQIEHFYGPLADEIWEYSCIILSFSGFFIRCFTVGYAPEGTSGRNTKEQRADKLNTTGMYSFCRHPLYLGNFIIMLGMSLFIQVWWFILIYLLLFTLYYERIIFTEEAYLLDKFRSSYLVWANKTPAFIPGLRNWNKPSLPFSLRNVLRREYSGFFAIIASYTLIEIGGDLIVDKTLEIDPVWIVFFVVGLVIYLTLRVLKKKTKLLHVQGR